MLDRLDPRALARPSLQRLVDAFQDTSVFSMLSGPESLCVDVLSGSFPIRVRYVEVGTRRPLGVGAGGLAMLAMMPQEERAPVLPNAARLAKFPRFTPESVKALVEETKARGYSLLVDTILDDAAAIGVAVRGRDGRPLGAFSISAISKRVLTRVHLLAAALQREADDYAERWYSSASDAHRR